MLLLGYAAYRTLPGEIADYGRFRNLNFGRVLASILAVTSILGAAIGRAVVTERRIRVIRGVLVAGSGDPALVTGYRENPPGHFGFGRTSRC